MKKILFSVALLFLLLVFSPLYAGQALYIDSAGDFLSWDASAAAPISIHPESGDCGQYTNAQMLTRLEANLDEWATLTYVDLDFNIVPGTLGSVDGTNYTSYLAGVLGTTAAQETANVQDGINPILFDDDGEIIDAATGEDNGRYTILGFASPDGFLLNDAGTDAESIVDGQAVFNCYCLDAGDGTPANASCGSTVFTTADLDFTMVHELGHFINLDHSQINTSYVTDSDATNDAEIPTMYPASFSAAEQKIPMQDDITTLASIYPSSSFFPSDFCKVTGTLLDRYGDALRCADFQAITADGENNTSFVSGSYASATDSNGDGYTDGTGECLSGCGDFLLYLEPGETYTFNVVSVISSFIGGSSVGPCATSQLAACTTAMLDRCTDGDSDTACTPCVANEILSVNDDSENLTSTVTASCTAGATIAFGNITTLSALSDGTTPDTTTTAGCSFNKSANGFSSMALFWMGLFLISPIIIRRVKYLV